MQIYSKTYGNLEDQITKEHSVVDDDIICREDFDNFADDHLLHVI